MWQEVAACGPWHILLAALAGGRLVWAAQAMGML